MNLPVKGNGVKRGASALALLAVLAVPSAAAAQQKTFYLDRLQIAGSPDDGVAIWRPQFNEKTRLFGQFGIGLSVNPFRVENYVDTSDQSKIIEQQTGHPVPLQLTTYFNAGAEIMDRVAFQVSFPLAVFQDSNSLCTTAAAVCLAVDQKPVVPMDLRLDGRVVFFRNDARTFKLGAIASLWVPSGNEYSFGGDVNTTGGFGFAAEYDAKIFAVTLNTGVHFRPTTTLKHLTISHELTYGLGAFLPLMDDRLRIGAEVFGSMGLADGTAGDVDNSPIEARLEGRLGLGEKPSHGWVSLSGGTRLSAGYAPDFRAVAMIGGWFTPFDTEPKQRDFLYVFPPDTDKDKLPDDIDMCPNAAEDGKGMNPDDGCPELLNDADSDGVPDTEDNCPREPGAKDSEATKNGCPEFIRRKKDSDLIEVLKEVQFAFDRADLLPAAFPILNEVVRLLRVNPDIELVRIEGHTDDFGSHKYNDDLSQNRAESVMRYLVQRGIVQERLEAKGVGKRRPIVENSTPEGRQKNRRVEFHIVKAKGNPLVQGTPLGGSDTPPPGGTTPPPGGTTPPPGGTTPAPGGTTPAPGGTTPPPGGAAPAPGGSGAPSAPPPKPGGTTAAVAPPAPGTPPKPTASATPSAAPAAPPKPAPTGAAPSAAPAVPPKPAPSAAPTAPK